MTLDQTHQHSSDSIMQADDPHVPINPSGGATPTLAEVLAAGNETGDQGLTITVDDSDETAFLITHNGEPVLSADINGDTDWHLDGGAWSLVTAPFVELFRVSEDGVRLMGLLGAILLDADRTTGLVRLPGLPTSDPAVAGALWSDAGVVKVSAG